MKTLLSLGLLLFSAINSHITFAVQPPHYISLLKEMFTKVVIDKNDRAIPMYYGNNFELYSNGKKMTYDEFFKSHQIIYKTGIQYRVRYDENTLIEQGNKVAGRIFITIKNPNEPAHEIEVILIAEYKNNKLYKFWELTYPDWSKMSTFQKLKITQNNAI